jgi:hypothetical protein
MDYICLLSYSHTANSVWHALSSNHIVDIVHDAFTLS